VGTLVVVFFVSLLAATLLPFYSEVLVGVLLLEGHDPFALWVAATLGNTLGSVVNWALARYLLHFQDRRWFPISVERLEAAQAWFERWGKWTLLLAWAPAGGDALTFAAGLLRTRLDVFVLLVGLGKGARYAVLIALVERVS